MRWVVISLVVGGLTLLFAWSPVERRREVLAPSDEAARVYFGEAESVGQSFVPLTGLREIHLPVGRRDKEAKSPFILHLRSEYFGADMRTAVIFAPPAETENLTFQFEALRRVPEQMIWVLEAPHGPKRAYWVYREPDASAFPEGTALASGRNLKGNFAFTQTGSQPQFATWVMQWKSSMQAWEKQSVFLFLAGVILYLLLAPRIKLRMGSGSWWVAGLAVATVGLHIWFARQLPLIIDEGAYLQDARQTQLGGGFAGQDTFLPFRDFLTKGPVYVLLLKTWLAISPDTLVGWRLLSALSWAGVVGAVAALARRFGLSASAQIIAAALLALLPGVIAATVPLLLQVVSTLFAVLAIFILLKGSQERRMSLIAVGALLMAAGYLTRSSTVAAGLAGAVLVLLFAQQRWRAFGVYVGTGIAAMAVVAAGAWLTLGVEKTAVLLNLEAVTVGGLQAAQAGGVEPVIRWLVQTAEMLWRGGSWLLTGVVALPLALARWLPRRLRLLLLGVWGAVIANVVYHLSDMGYSLPGVLLTTRVTMLVVAFGIPAVWLLHWLWIQRRGEGGSRLGWRPVVVCLAWLVLLVVVYRSWGVFRPSYIVEFLPAAAILAAGGLVYGLQRLGRRGLSQTLLVGLFLAGWWQGVSLALSKPISGTITVEAAEAIGQLVRKKVPPEAEIFTAQPVVTAAAGRAIVRGYSHPGWIRAERVGGIPPGLRAVYFADGAEITRWLDQEVRFVVTDERTSEIYFDDFPERQAILREKFEVVGEVPNDLTEEPFRLYERRDPIRTPAESE